ncbi:MAG: protein translocase subunit SecF [Deltaproteobacteria bacterium]|nr:protein translocase subunit SecF [Deltaproteobacteria bacterium]
MELIKPNTNFDFVHFFKYAYTFSLALIFLGLASLWYHGGPNYGVDFAGGIVVQVKFTQPTSIADIRQALEATDIANVTVQDFGQGGNEFLIRLPIVESAAEGFSGQVQKGLSAKFGEPTFEVHRGQTSATGDMVVQVKFTQPTNGADIEQALAAAGLVNVTVEDSGRGGNEFVIREAGTEGLSAKVQKALSAKFVEPAFEVRRVEAVGPKVGSELRRKALLAVLFSTVMMGIYIAFRFEPRFGVGAAIALLHDVLITAGALSLMNMEFDLTVVAALLTIVGFSVNDTVIVCDRIRENMRKLRRENLAGIINRSVNETLSRTIITTGTAVLVIIALFFLGGEVIHAFAFALLVGFTIGTYSSIYVASPFVLLFEKKGRRR